MSSMTDLVFLLLILTGMEIWIFMQFWVALMRAVYIKMRFLKIPEGGKTTGWDCLCRERIQID